MAFASDTYEIARRLLIYYNAQCNYENNKKGLYTYFKQYNSLTYLSETLQNIKDKNLQKESYGNKAYGIQATVPIKDHYRRMIRDFLLKPYEICVPKINEEGETEEIQETIPSLRRIVFRALLKELSS
jgi:hypothetical protein